MLPHLGQLRSPTKDSSLTNTITIPQKYRSTKIQFSTHYTLVQGQSLIAVRGGNHSGLVTNLSQIWEAEKINSTDGQDALQPERETSEKW